MPKIKRFTLRFFLNLCKHLHILESKAGLDSKTEGNNVLFKLLKIFGILLLSIALMYLGLGVYFSKNKDKIKNDLTALINEKSSGEITIGDLEVSLFQSFPRLTIQVKEVLIKDSLWNRHKRTLLKADKVYAKVAPWAILNKTISVNNLTVRNATANIYIDGDGYSNFSVFSNLKEDKKSDGKKSLLDIGIDKIDFKDITFISENQVKGKYFNFKTTELKVLISHNATGWNATADVEAFVNSMTFNSLRGSYAKNKTIDGKIDAVYNSTKKQIGVYSKELNIGGNPFEFKATFGTSKTNSLFKIMLFSSSVQWKEASSLLSNNVQSKLKRFNLSEPFDVRAVVKGNLKVRGNPSIHVIAHIKNNELTGKIGRTITNCSFRAEFTNNYIKNGIFGDPNSAVFLHDLKGVFNEIPFTTKDFMIYNLKKPTASGYIKTSFDVTRLNSVFNKELIHFVKGKANASVKFKADVVDLDISKPFITGIVTIDNADFTYGPRNFNVHNCNLKLKFTQDKLNIETFNFETQRSKFAMKGHAGNFMNLYYDNPEKIVLFMDVNCPQIDLSELIFLVGSKNGNKNKKITNPKTKSEFLEKTLSSSSLVLNLNIDKLIYKKFTGTNTVAQISFSDDIISIKKVGIKKGNGSIALSGAINRRGNSNDYNLKINVAKVDIRDLLYSFDNFGSSTITYKNITGIIDLNTNLKGAIYDNGAPVKNSLIADLQFNLRNGAFIHFMPLEKMGKVVFPARNFEKVTFERIDGDFKISNRKVYISPMQINSSVMNFDFGGVYALEKGTDLNVDVYLRNPEKDKGITNPKILKAKRDTGLTVHLQATDGPDGKVKIKVRSVKAK